MIKAIETKYKGYRFRSRLEARWAVFFDCLNLDWAYEPQGFDLGELGWYLPDFVISYELNNFGPIPTQQFSDKVRQYYFIEIKGGKPTEIEVEKISRICEEFCCYGAVFAGEIPERFDCIPNWIHVHKEVGATLDCLGVEEEETFWSFLSRCRKRDGELCKISPFEFEYYSALANEALIAARSARFEHGESPR